MFDSGNVILSYPNFPVASMRGHQEVPQNPPEAAHLSRLLFYKHLAPVSPLECALPRFPATVHSKRLTRSANSFRMRTYAKTGGRGPRPFPPSRPPFTLKETYFRTLPPVFRIFFQVPYAVSPLLATLTKTAGVYPLSSHSGTRQSSLATRHFPPVPLTTWVFTPVDSPCILPGCKLTLQVGYEFGQMGLMSWGIGSWNKEGHDVSCPYDGRQG